MARLQCGIVACSDNLLETDIIKDYQGLSWTIIHGLSWINMDYHGLEIAPFRRLDYNVDKLTKDVAMLRRVVAMLGQKMWLWKDGHGYMLSHYHN